MAVKQVTASKQAAAEKQVTADRQLYSTLSRFGFAVASLLLVGGISGASWGTAYVRTELVPQLSQELSQAIKRPIQLGSIEQVSWSGVRFGRSVLPATATAADTLTVQAIDIHFNPLQALRHQQLKLTITLIQPTAFLDQDKTGKWLNLDLKFDPNAPVEVEQIRLRDATVTLEPRRIVSTRVRRGRRHRHPWSIADIPTQMTLRRVNGQFSLREQGQRLVFEMAAQPHERGTIRLKGDVRFDRDQMWLAIQTNQLQIKSLAPFIPTDLKLDAGVLNADLNLNSDPGKALQVVGVADLQQAAARTKGEPNPFSGINAHLQFQGRQVALSRGQLRFGQIPFQLDGTIDFQHGFALNARVPRVDAAPFMQTLKLKVPFPVQGAIAADNLHIAGPFQHPILSGTAHAAEPIKFDHVTMASVEGRFSLALIEDHLWLHEISLKPVVGGTITATAEAWLANEDAKINIAVKNIQADSLAKLYRLPSSPELRLGQLNAEAKAVIAANRPSLTADWSLAQGSYPVQGKVAFANQRLQLHDTAVQIGDGKLIAAAELQPTGWQASLISSQVPLEHLPLQQKLPGRLEGQLQLSGSSKNFGLAQGKGEANLQFGQGTVAANFQAAEGQWQADVNGSEIPLNLFVNQPGVIAGNVKLQGSLTALNLAETQAKGTVQVAADGLTNTPVNAEFNWNGEKLYINRAYTDGIQANGWVAPILINNRLSRFGDLNLNIDVKNYDLETSPFIRPLIKKLPVAVTGITNLKGTISGTADAPQINSEVQLDRFGIQGFQFQPLRGQIVTRPDRQISLELRGQQDRIALNLDSAYHPTNFLIQLDQARAEGQFLDNKLLTQLENFDLEKLNFAPAGLGPVRGKLAGNAEVDWVGVNQTSSQQPSLRAVINVAQPGIGNSHTTAPDHANDRFSGTVTYRNGTASLSEAALQLGNSHYALAAQLNPATAQWSGQIATEQARFEDLLNLLTPAEQADLIDKFASMAQMTQVTQAEASAASLQPLALPRIVDLANLSGKFSGAATLHNSAQGVAVQFGLQGEDWRLGDYGIRQLTVSNAEFDGKTLTLPAVAAAGFALTLNGKPQQFNAHLNFAGQVAANTLSGLIQLNGIALSQIQSAFNLPLQLQGQVDATALLSGQPSQPNLNGQLHLQGVNLPNMPIEEAKVGFSYINRKFHLESWQSLGNPVAASSN